MMLLNQYYLIILFVVVKLQTEQLIYIYVIDVKML